MTGEYGDTSIGKEKLAKYIACMVQVFNGLNHLRMLCYSEFSMKVNFSMNYCLQVFFFLFIVVNRMK